MTENTKIMNSLATLARDYWRLLRSYERLIAESALNNHNRLKSNYRNAERRLSIVLDEYNLKIISYEGKKYTPNLAVTVVNADEFSDNDELIINQMLEPTVMHGEQVLNIGKAILSKEEDV
jgi:hypothetical protein